MASANQQQQQQPQQPQQPAYGAAHTASYQSSASARAPLGSASLYTASGASGCASARGAAAGGHTSKLAAQFMQGQHARPGTAGGAAGRPASAGMRR